jgi:hypothetical protein
VNERTDPSKSLFEDISSDEDILYVKGNEPLSGNETPEKDSTGEIKDIKNSDGKQLEHNSSLEEGRTVSHHLRFLITALYLLYFSYFSLSFWCTG